MNEKDLLAERFETDRAHLERVAYRMLGSLPEAQDAVQESWLRLVRADSGAVGNLTGWLTTVVARICLDMLRSRKARREEPADLRTLEPVAGANDAPDHERELADSVGIALLVVLQALEPAERIAFVLHDMFELPFDEISPILGRSADATRQLASRARRRVRGAPKDANAAADRTVVDAFLAAARQGDFDGLLSVLDPNVVVGGDATTVRMGGMSRLDGATAVARAFQGRAQAARVALVGGRLGFVVAPKGCLLLAVDVTIVNGRITALQAIADPDRLARTEFALAD
jgi:RNA polymerase sigma-70 factor (ECF subfamily)